MKAKTKTFTAEAGANKFSLGKFKAGTYRLTTLATDANGAASKPLRTAFKVKPKRR